MCGGKAACEYAMWPASDCAVCLLCTEYMVFAPYSPHTMFNHENVLFCMVFHSTVNSTGVISTVEHATEYFSTIPQFIAMCVFD